MHGLTNFKFMTEQSPKLPATLKQIVHVRTRNTNLRSGVWQKVSVNFTSDIEGSVGDNSEGDCLVTVGWWK
jgi:hypothetical protein